MYHKIKALRLSYSVREAAEMLEVSPGSVQKYSHMSLKEGSEYLSAVKRKSQYAIAHDFIDNYISQFPKIRATKLHRKVLDRYPEITGGVRSFRNYIKPIYEKYKNNKIRRYHPVLDNLPGKQVQVDPGEYRVSIDSSGNKLKVYFVSFVFSYSRMMYVHFQNRPYNTEDFLKAHLEAFHYFGGVSSEYVYDQTKLVVIEEKYREVWFNQKFHQFALKYEFLPVVCEGYDPESKGKVERTVRYIKEDFLYGDFFKDIEQIRKESIIWLNEIANSRLHATTKRSPATMFLEEKVFLNTKFYVKASSNSRLVDKTGLISYQGNKYSIPSNYQRQEILIEEEKNILFIRDKKSGQEIAHHPLSTEKGKIIINNNHYRDFEKTIAQLTEEVESLLSGIEHSSKLIMRIKADNPKIIRDQLRGLRKFAKKYPTETWQKAISDLLILPQVRASLIEKMLISVKQSQQSQKIIKYDERNQLQPSHFSTLDRSLSDYMKGVKNA